MIVWDPYQPNGGNTKEAIKRAKLILWKGHCSVHQMFQPVHVDHFRKQYPDGKVIVHPECHEDVVNKADLIGSTEFIIRTVTAAPAGTTWAVGTELNLVNRLKHELTDKKVFSSPPRFANARPCSALMPPISAGPWRIWLKDMSSIGLLCLRTTSTGQRSRWIA